MHNWALDGMIEAAWHMIWQRGIMYVDWAEYGPGWEAVSV